MMAPTENVTVTQALRRLIRDPRGVLWRRWNWKSAVTSSAVRAVVFLVTNLSAGVPAALRAMLVEFGLRAVTAGFYGAMTENLRDVRPRRHGLLAALVVVPGVAHTAEAVVHLLNGTPNLGLSLAASIMFTMVSTSFNLYAMQRGVLIVGEGRQPLTRDLARTPRLVLEFLSSPVRRMRRRDQRRLRRRLLAGWRA